MKLLSTPRISPQGQCPYFKDKLEMHEFFFATDFDRAELDFLLSNGWRKFGEFQFRPKCQDCQKCIPLRVKINKFTPSKSQRKIVNKNRDIDFFIKDLIFKKEYFALYKKHSEARFGTANIENEEDFRQSFFNHTGTQKISEFYLEGKLVAFGILEIGENALSSVYFVFAPELSKRNLGTFGVLKEIEYGLENDYSYYYLGYWIEENKSMNYKNDFKPNEVYDWSQKKWFESI